MSEKNRVEDAKTTSKKHILEIISDLPDNANIQISINEKKYLMTPTGYITEVEEPQENFTPIPAKMYWYTNMIITLNVENGWKIWTGESSLDPDIYNV